MWRLLKLCALSVLVYVAIFGFFVDRPLSLGVLRLELLQKAARLAALPSPKLVILAGSDGPYSHSCEAMSQMLNIPCENAGIAVGIGLDDIFIRYAPHLHSGDVVYMPMEFAQYTASSAAYRAAVDGAFLLRHDRGVLMQLPLPRVAGAVFCCTLGDLSEALAEMPLVDLGVIKPESLLAGEYDAQGDRVDNLLSGRDTALLPKAPRKLPPAAEIEAGYGSSLIAAFVAREAREGVIVVGGMPVGYTQPQPDQLIAALKSVYIRNGGRFLLLPDHSEYPRADFFNSEDHLVRPCQFMHSVFVAQHLAVLLGRRVVPPSAAVSRLAAECPSAASAN